MFGLGNGDSDQGYGDIEYPIHTYAGTERLLIYEGGVYRGLERRPPLEVRPAAGARGAPPPLWHGTCIPSVEVGVLGCDHRRVNRCRRVP
jgi:hypothetical protein